MMTGQDEPEGAVRRLTSGIEPASQRNILVRCLTGALTPAATLRTLLEEAGDPAHVRAVVDDVTERAASVSRATDSLLRDRVDELTQLLVESEREAAL